MSDSGHLPNARFPHGGIDDRMRRSAAARKGARVRKARAAMREAEPARDGEWGPDGARRGSAEVGGVHSIAEILARLPGGST